MKNTLLPFTMSFTIYLLLLLQEINNHLAKLTKEESIEIAGKITTVCNACFDTYVHDIEATPVQLGKAEISLNYHFHKQKINPYVIPVKLERDASWQSVYT